MKFKVGDMVRLTREAIASKKNRNYEVFEFEVIGVEVIGIKDGAVTYKYEDRCYRNEYEANLELVPEEPEFEEGEMIEVSDDGKKWEKRIYLTTVGSERKFYICVSDKSIERYKSGLTYNASSWEYARKLKPQLKRKEIAEKFGVSEDFTLVD